MAMMALWIVRPFATLARVLVARWPRRQQVLCWITMSISVILCLAYAPLTGGGAPVRRAAVAVALAATLSVCGLRAERGQLSDRCADLWAAALVFECWLDPGAVCEVSVQLSYGATLGLILGTRPVAACLTRSLGVHLETAPRELLHGPGGACLAAWRRRAVRAGITGVAASLSAVCATAPVIWWTFGEACPWGVLTTPLLAPLFVLLFGSGMLMLLTPGPRWKALHGHRRALMEAMSFVDSLPGTPMLLPERPGWLVCGAVGLGWWVVGRTRPGLETGSSASTDVPGRWPRLGALPRAASLASAAALALPWSAAPADFELHALAWATARRSSSEAPGSRAGSSIAAPGIDRGRPRTPCVPCCAPGSWTGRWWCSPMETGTTPAGWPGCWSGHARGAG
ncbi:MAG: ComEC/Rec2 family competence protein [Planctomycetes bacterium]|nr:ComEC/Rec2 family competence protein [Planctomycetota bacterium]